MKTRLVTVMWSTTIQVELPDDATVESLGFGGAHNDLEYKIVEEAGGNLSWKSGEITAIDEIPDDISPNHEYDARFDEGGEFHKEASKA